MVTRLNIGMPVKCTVPLGVLPGSRTNRKLSERTFSLLFADEPEITSDTEAFRALRT